MPTYEYLCESCGARFDRFQKMSDDPLTVCPTCAGHVHRVLHATGILFKGSGFYKTDSKASSSASVAPASSDAAPAASSASSTPASSTPASSGSSAPSKATTTPAAASAE